MHVIETKTTPLAHTLYLKADKEDGPALELGPKNGGATYLGLH
jgi:hypothetical protein